MNQTTDINKPGLKNRLNVQIAVLIFVRFVFNTFFRMIYPFLSVIANGLGVDLRTISYAIFTRSLTGLIGPFLASVADSRGRKIGMLLGMLTFTIAICLIVFWPTFTAFFIGLSLSFIGYLIYVPSMQAYVGDRVPYENRGRILGITEFSWSLSAIIGVPLLGLIIAQHGWMAPFPLIVFLGALSFIGMAWIIPKDTVPQHGSPRFWSNLRKIFTYPPAIAALVMAALYTAANETISLIYGVWVKQAFALNIASLGATAIAIGVSELGGETLVTLFTDKIGKRKAIAIGIIGNCLASLSLPILGRWLAGAMVGLFLFYLTFEFTVVSGLPLMSEILPSARATMLAAHMALLAVGRSIGDLLAPTLFTQSIFPGILANATAAFLFDLMALFALSRVRISQIATTDTKL